MAGHNRYLRGSMSEIFAPVRGNIVVEPGDLMYKNEQVSNYAYPFDENKTATAGTAFEEDIYTNFLGVATQGSETGVTENITIATGGVFRYPLDGTPSAVTLGSLVSAVSPSVSGSGGSVQAVVNHATATGNGTTAYLWYCVKTESAASFVDFQIRTIFTGLAT
jgi:hypothetical protein